MLGKSEPNILSQMVVKMMINPMVQSNKSPTKPIQIRDKKWTEKNVRRQIFKQQISDEQLSVCCCFSLKSSHVCLDQGRFTSVLFTASKDIMSNTRMFVVGHT